MLTEANGWLYRSHTIVYPKHHTHTHPHMYTPATVDCLLSLFCLYSKHFATAPIGFVHIFQPLSVPGSNVYTYSPKHLQSIRGLIIIVPLLLILDMLSNWGLSPNWGPYCSFCYRSPVWMWIQTHTCADSTKCILVGNYIVCSFVCVLNILL